MLKQISTLIIRRLACCLILAASVLLAAVNTASAASPAVIVTNPPSAQGVHIGDVLTRTIVIEVPGTYALAENGLPKKGSKHNGIELVGVALQSKTHADLARYTVQLDYQVFAASTAPVVMQLPAENLTLTRPSAASMRLAVPAWEFWFSPLVTGGTTTARQNILPEVKTPMIDSHMHRQWLGLSVVIAVISLLALLYINADGQWLPLMGGAFARAHRQLKRLARSSSPKTAVEEKKALVVLHQAFNQHYGANIFARDIEHFLTLRPGFKGMQREITQFFEASNQSLYETGTRDSRQVIAQLVQLSKRLRDCERGVS